MFRFIATIIDPLIIVFGIGVLAALIYVTVKLKELKNDLSEKFYSTSSKAILNKKTLALKRREIAPSRLEDVDELRENFNNLISKYITCAQMIPIFPLLGILGTVTGLILEVQTADAQAIYNALSTAMTSTFYGLIASIVLKFVEAFFTLKDINYIESELDEYDRSFRDAITMQNFAEENQE